MSNYYFNQIKKNIRQITELPLVKIEDQISINPPRQKITPIVYQTWVSNEFGRSHAKSILKFRELNKNLTFKIYSDLNMDNYMKDNWANHEIYNIYKKALIGPLRTDIFRYCILYKEGGYYFDISRGCKVPLTKLHNKNSTGIITFEDTFCYIPPRNDKVFKLLRPFNHVLQWGLGFEKKNKFLDQLINSIIKAYPMFKNKVFSNPKIAILNFTGPGMYTAVLRDFISKHNINNFTQLDIKFNNQGIFKIKGSQFRYYSNPSYTYFENCKICN